MLDPTPSRSPETKSLPPASPRRDRLEAKKWPPDDDDLPADPPGGGGAAGGGGGPIGPYDGDFKKGRFNPKFVLAALGAVVIGSVLALLALKTDASKLSMDQIVAQKKGVWVLGQPERLARWRDLAAQTDDYELQAEGLAQIAWADDKSGVDLAIRALGQIDHRVRGLAAQVLAHYGTPAADAAKPALLKALDEADDSDRPQIAWALIALREPSVFDRAIGLYRMGHLHKVLRLGGGPAFDPEAMASLVPLETIAKLAGDPSESVRQLVALVLSKNAEPRFTDTLVALVKDESIDVAREAATGLGKIADERARGPLVAALSKADKLSRQKFLEALQNGIGGEGLVLALSTVGKDKVETTWHQTKQIFDLLEKLSDPRVGDSLAKYLASTPAPHHHWQTAAALRMAEVGDLRAVPYLAERLTMSPLKVYTDANDYEKMMKRDDKERVVSARMLADLAVLHPEAKDDIRAKTEDAVIGWLHEHPEPHSNGLRVLAVTGSTKDIVALRKWADPTVALPKEGQQPPMPYEWEIAQSAMRYVGWLKDQPSWATLEKGLKRRDPKIDMTMDALMGSGTAMLGMAVRAVEVGAADGFAQWGDPKAFPLLVKLIEDPMENEQARDEACFALPGVAPAENMAEIGRKVHEFKSKDPKKQIIERCYLEALTHRATPNVSATLVDLLDKNLDVELRHRAARAIGLAGVDAKTEAALMAKLGDPDAREDAALAIVLGGSTEAATRVVAQYADFPKEALDELKDIYQRSFGYISDEDFTKGRLYRWVETSEALARVRVRETPQVWARALLQRHLANSDFDNGPHSMTRVVLRCRLVEAAKKGDSAAKKGAIRTLKFMSEQGALMALRREAGETGELARRAFFELLNPPPLESVGLPAAPAEGQAAKK